MTSFNDKTAHELFTCAFVCVYGGAGGLSGVNNSEKSRLFSGGEGKDTSETYGRKSH